MAKVNVNGVKLHCTVAGRGLHALLCIPGAVVPSLWAQLEHFSTESNVYTIVAFDPRGYGHSRPPDRNYQLTPQHHLKMDATDAYELMVALGFQRFSVLGWCDGGITALAMAYQYPDAVRSVVVWGPRPYLTDDDVKRTEVLRDLNNWKPAYYEAVRQVYGLQTFTKVWHGYLDCVKAAHSLGLDRVVSTDEFAKITCPTLVIHGEKDSLTQQSHAEYITNYIPGCQIHVLPGGSHGPHMDPGIYSQFNSVVDSFLSSNVHD